jgi:hypothetical protein
LPVERQYHATPQQNAALPAQSGKFGIGIRPIGDLGQSLF